MAEALVAFDEKPEKSERKRRNREQEGVTKIDYKSVSPGNSPRSSQPDSDDQEQQDLRDELCRLLPHASRLPKRVKCHQCAQVMRLIYRSSDHTSVASISFRCPSRGCQTFKSPRQILRKMFPGLAFPRKDKLIESGSGKIDRLLQVSRKRAASEAPMSTNTSRNRKTMRHRSEELKEDYGRKNRKEELKADYDRKRQQLKDDCCENRRSEKLKEEYSRKQKNRNEELKKEDHGRNEKRRRTDLDGDSPSLTSRTPKKTVESKVHGTRRYSSSGKDSDMPFVITGPPKKTVESKVHGTRSHSSGGKSISATTKAWIELLKHNSDFEAESDDDDLNNASYSKDVKPYRPTPKVRHSGKGSKRIYSVEQEGTTPRRRSHGKQIPTYRTPSHPDSESSGLTSDSDSDNEDVKPHRVAPQPQVRHSGKGSKGIYGMNVKQEGATPRRLPNGKQIPTYRTPCLPDRDGSRIASSVPRSLSTDTPLPLFADVKVPYLLDDVNANYVNTTQPPVGIVDIGMEEVLNEYICSDSLDLDGAAMADDKIGDLENLQDIFPNISDDGSLDKYLMMGNERVPFNLIFSMLDDQDGGSYQDDVNTPSSTTVMSGEEERRSSKIFTSNISKMASSGGEPSMVPDEDFFSPSQSPEMEVVKEDDGTEKTPPSYHSSLSGPSESGARKVTIDTSASSSEGRSNSDGVNGDSVVGSMEEESVAGEKPSTDAVIEHQPHLPPEMDNTNQMAKQEVKPDDPLHARRDDVATEVSPREVAGTYPSSTAATVHSLPEVRVGDVDTVPEEGNDSSMEKQFGQLDLTVKEHYFSRKVDIPITQQLVKTEESHSVHSLRHEPSTRTSAVTHPSSMDVTVSSLADGTQLSEDDNALTNCDPKEDGNNPMKPRRGETHKNAKPKARKRIQSNIAHRSGGPPLHPVGGGVGGLRGGAKGAKEEEDSRADTKHDGVTTPEDVDDRTGAKPTTTSPPSLQTSVDSTVPTCRYEVLKRIKSIRLCGHPSDSSPVDASGSNHRQEDARISTNVVQQVTSTSHLSLQTSLIPPRDKPPENVHQSSINMGALSLRGDGRKTTNKTVQVQKSRMTSPSTSIQEHVFGVRPPDAPVHSFIRDRDATRKAVVSTPPQGVYVVDGIPPVGSISSRVSHISMHTTTSRTQMVTSATHQQNSGPARGPPPRVDRGSLVAPRQNLRDYERTMTVSTPKNAGLQGKKTSVAVEKESEMDVIDEVNDMDDESHVDGDARAPRKSGGGSPKQKAILTPAEKDAEIDVVSEVNNKVEEEHVEVPRKGGGGGRQRKKASVAVEKKRVVDGSEMNAVDEVYDKTTEVSNVAAPKPKRVGRQRRDTVAAVEMESVVNEIEMADANEVNDKEKEGKVAVFPTRKPGRPPKTSSGGKAKESVVEADKTVVNEVNDKEKEDNVAPRAPKKPGRKPRKSSVETSKDKVVEVEKNVVNEVKNNDRNDRVATPMLKNLVRKPTTTPVETENENVGGAEIAEKSVVNEVNENNKQDHVATPTPENLSSEPTMTSVEAANENVVEAEKTAINEVNDKGKEDDEAVTRKPGPVRHRKATCVGTENEKVVEAEKTVVSEVNDKDKEDDNTPTPAPIKPRGRQRKGTCFGTANENTVEAKMTVVGEVNDKDKEDDKMLTPEVNEKVVAVEKTAVKEVNGKDKEDDKMLTPAAITPVCHLETTSVGTSSEKVVEVEKTAVKEVNDKDKEDTVPTPAARKPARQRKGTSNGITENEKIIETEETVVNEAIDKDKEEHNMPTPAPRKTPVRKRKGASGGRTSNEKVVEAEKTVVDEVNDKEKEDTVPSPAPRKPRGRQREGRSSGTTANESVVEAENTAVNEVNDKEKDDSVPTPTTPMKPRGRQRKGTSGGRTSNEKVVEAEKPVVNEVNDKNKEEKVPTPTTPMKPRGRQRKGTSGGRTSNEKVVEAEKPVVNEVNDTEVTGPTPTPRKPSGRQRKETSGETTENEKIVEVGKLVIDEMNNKEKDDNVATPAPRNSSRQRVGTSGASLSVEKAVEAEKTIVDEMNNKEKDDNVATPAPRKSSRQRVGTSGASLSVDKVVEAEKPVVDEMNNKEKDDNVATPAPRKSSRQRMGTSGASLSLEKVADAEKPIVDEINNQEKDDNVANPPPAKRGRQSRKTAVETASDSVVEVEKTVVSEVNDKDKEVEATVPAGPRKSAREPKVKDLGADYYVGGGLPTAKTKGKKVETASQPGILATDSHGSRNRTPSRNRVKFADPPEQEEPSKNTTMPVSQPTTPGRGRSRGRLPKPEHNAAPPIPVVHTPVRKSLKRKATVDTVAEEEEGASVKKTGKRKYTRRPPQPAAAEAAQSEADAEEDEGMDQGVGGGRLWSSSSSSTETEGRGAIRVTRSRSRSQTPTSASTSPAAKRGRDPRFVEKGVETGVSLSTFEKPTGYQVYSGRVFKSTIRTIPTANTSSEAVLLASEDGVVARTSSVVMEEEEEEEDQNNEVFEQAQSRGENADNERGSQSSAITATPSTTSPQEKKNKFVEVNRDYYEDVTLLGIVVKREVEDDDVEENARSQLVDVTKQERDHAPRAKRRREGDSDRRAARGGGGVQALQSAHSGMVSANTVSSEADDNKIMENRVYEWLYEEMMQGSFPPGDMSLRLFLCNVGYRNTQDAFMYIRNEYCTTAEGREFIRNRSWLNRGQTVGTNSLQTRHTSAPAYSTPREAPRPPPPPPMGYERPQYLEHNVPSQLQNPVPPQIQKPVPLQVQTPYAALYHHHSHGVPPGAYGGGVFHHQMFPPLPTPLTNREAEPATAPFVEGTPVYTQLQAPTQSADASTDGYTNNDTFSTGYTNDSNASSQPAPPTNDYRNPGGAPFQHAPNSHGGSAQSQSEPALFNYSSIHGALGQPARTGRPGPPFDPSTLVHPSDWGAFHRVNSTAAPVVDPQIHGNGASFVSGGYGQYGPGPAQGYRGSDIRMVPAFVPPPPPPPPPPSDAAPREPSPPPQTTYAPPTRDENDQQEEQNEQDGEEEPAEETANRIAIPLPPSPHRAIECDVGDDYERVMDDEADTEVPTTTIKDTALVTELEQQEPGREPEGEAQELSEGAPEEQPREEPEREPEERSEALSATGVQQPDDQPVEQPDDVTLETENTSGANRSMGEVHTENVQRERLLAGREHRYYNVLRTLSGGAAHKQVVAQDGQRRARRGQKWAHGGQERAHHELASVHGGQESAHDGQASLHGGEDSAHGGQESAHGGQESAHGGQKSAHGGQESAHGGEDSGHGGQESARGGQESAHGGQEQDSTVDQQEMMETGEQEQIPIHDDDVDWDGAMPYFQAPVRESEDMKEDLSKAMLTPKAMVAIAIARAADLVDEGEREAETETVREEFPVKEEPIDEHEQEEQQSSAATEQTVVAADTINNAVGSVTADDGIVKEEPLDPEEIPADPHPDATDSVQPIADASACQMQNQMTVGKPVSNLRWLEEELTQQQQRQPDTTKWSTLNHVNHLEEKMHHVMHVCNSQRLVMQNVSGGIATPGLSHQEYSNAIESMRKQDQAEIYSVLSKVRQELDHYRNRLHMEQMQQAQAQQNLVLQLSMAPYQQLAFSRQQQQVHQQVQQQVHQQLLSSLSASRAATPPVTVPHPATPSSNSFFDGYQQRQLFSMMQQFPSGATTVPSGTGTPQQPSEPVQQTPESEDEGRDTLPEAVDQ